MGRMEPGVSLYSRHVLIQKDCNKLLPEWLRFVKGNDGLRYNGSTSEESYRSCRF